MRIGFIGLGIMGKPMARNLVRAGHAVIGYSRTKAAVDAVADAGVHGAASVTEAVREAEVVITMLPDGPDVAAVARGDAGLFVSARPGALWIDMSTIDPALAVTLAGEARARGLRCLDAPVSGGDTGAIAGTLAIMVGGERGDFDAALPVFEALGRAVVYIGGAGHGQTAKLCNQVVGALTLLAVSEGLVLAERSGIDADAVLRAVSSGAAASWMLEHLGPRMLVDDFRAGFFVDLQLKDLRLVADQARRVGTPLPGAALVEQLFRAVSAAGGGRLGTQALITALRRLAAV